MIHLDRQKIEELEEKYGLPVYVFNKEEFIQNYHELRDAFRKNYPKYDICYSYKTNYTPAICRLVKKLGGYAEVVSDMEYRLAKSIGYTADQIVYNGPYKGQVLEEHLLNGGINNIDRIEEVERIIQLAESHPKNKIRTGIRVNFDIDAGYTSRFGIDVGQLGEVVILLTSHHVEINGLHCHMSRARGIEPWKTRTRTLLCLVREYDMFGLDYISLGSGMYGHMDPELAVQFSDVPSYEEYSSAVMGQFAEFFRDKNSKPKIFTEPGTTLVSKYVDFVAKVEGIKTIRGKTFILCNCSFHNLGETCQMKNLPMRLFPSKSEQPQQVIDADFVGYTCLEQDVLYRGYTGRVAIGDYVEFGNVGGYSLVDKPPFIQPNCAMVAVDSEEMVLIKKPETYDDIFHTFCQ